MRPHTPRLIGVLVLGAALTASACGLLSGDGDKKAACDTMESELNSLGSRAQSQVGNPKGLAQMYTDTAGKLRSEGGKTGGDVKSAADSVADDLDSLASSLRAAGSGTPQLPDLKKVQASGAKLRAACA